MPKKKSAIVVTAATGAVQQTDPIFWMDIDELETWDDNYNEGDVGLIAEGIQQYGFVGVVKVWGVNKVRGGNHTLMATRVLRDEYRQKGKIDLPPANIRFDNGKWLVPCASLRHLSEIEAIGFAIFDNRSAAKASQNDELLLKYLTSLRESEQEFATGYDDEDFELLSRLMNQPITMTPTADGVEASFDTFINTASIKQIVLYMDTVKFISTIERLSRVMQANGLENNTEVVLFLLDQYEAVHPQIREEEDEPLSA